MTDQHNSEDDIEALLDQVEKQYMTTTKSTTITIKPAPRKITSITQSAKCDCVSKTSTDWEEVEELLKDFKFEDTNPFAKQNNKSWIRQQLPGEEDGAEVKCFPVYLSGSYEPTGYSTVGAERPCDRLKCVKCDFDVLALDNYVWDPSTDYLFLRDNMPDFDKLVSRLSKKTGSRAYACQCQHINVAKITNINALPQLRWVCKKHSTSDETSKKMASTKYTRRF